MAARYAALFFLYVNVAAGAMMRKLRAPDGDHLAHEIIDNAKVKSGQPKTTDEKDFLYVDKNQDGKLDVKELRYKQYASGCEPSVAHARGLDYLQCGDTNKDGSISREEFEASTQPAWAACVKNLKDRRLHGFIRFFEADQDWDNQLSMVELRVGIQKMWGPAGDHLAKPLLECVDKDKNGYMSQSEFHDSIAAYNPATRSWQMWEGTSDPTILACLQPAFAKFDAALAFEIMDTNQNYKVSKQEYYDTLDAEQGHGMAKITMEKADAIFAAVDLDKSGDLNLDEFIKAGESYKGSGESFAIRGFTVKAKKVATTGMGAGCHDQNGDEWNAYVNIGSIPLNGTRKEAALRSTPKVIAAPAAPKALAVANATHKARTLTTMELGPFESLEAACEYCYASHTRTSVVPNCICTAYTADDGPTMFCTASQPGVAYSAAKDGACLCTEKNMAQMGKTTCDPHP